MRNIILAIGIFIMIYVSSSAIVVKNRYTDTESNFPVPRSITVYQLKKIIEKETGHSIESLNLYVHHDGKLRVFPGVKTFPLKSDDIDYDDKKLVEIFNLPATDDINNTIRVDLCITTPQMHAQALIQQDPTSTDQCIASLVGTTSDEVIKAREYVAKAYMH